MTTLDLKYIKMFEWTFNSSQNQSFDLVQNTNETLPKLLKNACSSRN